MKKYILPFSLLLLIGSSLVSGYFIESNDNLLFVSNLSSIKGYGYFVYSLFSLLFFIIGPIFLTTMVLTIFDHFFLFFGKSYLVSYGFSIGFFFSMFFPKYSIFLGTRPFNKFYFFSGVLSFILADFSQGFLIIKQLIMYLGQLVQFCFNLCKQFSAKGMKDDIAFVTSKSTVMEKKYELNGGSSFQSSICTKEPSKNNHVFFPDSKHKNLQSPKYKNSKTKSVNPGDYSKIVNFFSSTRRRDFVNEPSRSYFEDITNRIEDKLKDFKIIGEIINILKGPVVDTFELELGPGVKVSKITSSAEDLSLALLGAPLRIVYPMKGRTTVGIEVPRNPRDIIFLDQLVNSREFKETSHQLPLAMGKDAFGDPLLVDLASMPHMLVAGSTGAGKSVFINSVLISLLIKLDPSKLKLILIDPKQLELALYSKLPHLIMPVVTEASKASASLLWAVQEMERRYSIMKTLGVRNIEGYNDKIKSGDKSCIDSVSKFFDGQDFELPYIVVIVDEFADLILTKSGKEIETNICRLAAKARASGIHLIIATQRPSVDVITGLIKSNFPTRVSFRVTSSVDSRTILNSVGAERLLGKGDMLYKHGVETLRCHSSFVDEVEIEKLTNRLSELSDGFDPAVIDFLESGGDLTDSPYSSPGLGGGGDSLSGGDELYGAAVKLVAESRAASASMLQRRLKVGYNRAANLIEKMEDNGVVGPAQGSKPRKVLIDSAES